MTLREADDGEYVVLSVEEIEREDDPLTIEVVGRGPRQIVTAIMWQFKYTTRTRCRWSPRVREWEATISLMQRTSFTPADELNNKWVSYRCDQVASSPFHGRWSCQFEAIGHATPPVLEIHFNCRGPSYPLRRTRVLPTVSPWGRRCVCRTPMIGTNGRCQCISYRLIPGPGDPIQWEGTDEAGRQVILTPEGKYSYSSGGAYATNSWEQQGDDAGWNGHMTCPECDFDALD